MSTRIIVKNLPPYLTQDAFASHFKDYASPTDTRLQSSKSGKSRRFGFVGFSTDSEAEKAVQYWNNTYIGSTKISAELARTVDEEATSNYKRKRPVEDAVATAQSAFSGKRKRTETNEAEDPKFQEFLRLNERRAKSKTFLNDDEEFLQQAAVPDPVEDENPSGEEEYEDIPDQKNEEYEVIDHEEPQKANLAPAEIVRVAAEVPDDADDSEWLRNRTSRTLDLTDGLDEEPAVAGTAPKTVSSTTKLTENPVKRQLKRVAPTAPVKTEEELSAEREAEKEAARINAISLIKDTSRLFLRNLAFTVDQAALQDLFSHYGAIDEVHLLESRSGTPKGTAYIQYENARDAVSAFTDLDSKSFHGRLLHILPAQAKISVEKPAVPGVKLNVGEKRKEERRKEAAKSRFNWNSLFLNQNAVLDNTAKKFGVSKSELLDPSQSNAAVTMALAESSALNTIKKFFLSHGVNLQSFSQSKKKDDSILLFKNLPSHANEEELRKLVESAGGVIRRIVIPEIGGLAIVEVVDANQGKAVFSKLAYRKFGDGLIYLEKGPVDTFNSAAPAATEKTSGGEDAQAANADEEEEEEEEEEEDEEVDQEARSTLFVKNLNFESRADDLTQIFQSLKGFRKATVKTKPNPKDASAARLSMGFGFIEFGTERDARAAMDVMQNFTLQDHALVLSLSSRTQATTDGGKKRQQQQKTGTKVVVKNLPFETTKADVAKLFSTYGGLKSLRLPKKFNAHLRGFAFLEFVSAREAANAIAGVEGTHLLGRRLVLEYATAEADGDAGVDRLVERTRRKAAALDSVQQGTRRVGKVNLDEVDPFEQS